MQITLDSPVLHIPRVGASMAEKLEMLEIRTVKDFLYHIPFRYDDFRHITRIRDIRADTVVTIKALIMSFAAFVTKNGKRMQEARVSDETGTLSVVWFNQPFLRNVITKGSSIRLSGSISWFNKKLVMNSPQYEIINDEYDNSLHTGRLVPIYPETAGLTSKWFRGRVHALLDEIKTSIQDPLPDEIRLPERMPSLYEALHTIHFPQTIEQATMAKKRLAFDELLLLQLTARIEKNIRNNDTSAYSFAIKTREKDRIMSSLPFSLTPDQLKAIEDIESDLKKTTPMNRLLQGDVGSGKTIVAAIALLHAYQNGLQSVFLAPTQILAEQHYKSLTHILGIIGADIRLMTANTKSRTPATITIGTHALLSDDVSYTKLGLVIVDEQHRFGVHQRAKLTEKIDKTHVAHLLTMTATPIPRTLAKTIFGSMDISHLHTMPVGRQRVKTWVVEHQKRTKAYAWMEKQIRDTQSQAFIICPLIEESEHFEEVKSVKAEYEKLTQIFPTLRLGLLHGGLMPNEKTHILGQFRDRQFDILVATPVVEVGIDIPNATIMMIEGSERFGLGQLHQLRGRVGRGEKPSYCLLFTSSNQLESTDRLKAMENLHNGADLAEVDMRLRGAGDILGSRQHGASSMKIATYMDSSMVERTYNAANAILTKDPMLENLPLLRDLIKKGKIETITQD